MSIGAGQGPASPFTQAVEQQGVTPAEAAAGGALPAQESEAATPPPPPPPPLLGRPVAPPRPQQNPSHLQGRARGAGAPSDDVRRRRRLPPQRPLGPDPSQTLRDVLKPGGNGGVVEDLQATLGNLEEVDSLCRVLLAVGIASSAVPGRRLRSRATAPECQVLMAKRASAEQGSSDVSGAPGLDRDEERLLVRVGNEVQEVAVCVPDSRLLRDSLPALIRSI
ncbi:hypothetical protein WJX81_003216 [Elliptochloris bilobata]|uniref:Uncharacterized protein n=1 Tax=Elliptochloris bilobata TaxID=381761 RepID=A0AAW1QKW1_9CHLO